MNEHDYNTGVNKGYEAGKREAQLVGILQEIPMIDANMLRWKASNAHRITSLDLDESERALAEWAEMCQCKGELLRLAESLYPNKAICTAIGYHFFCHIRADIRRIDRFRGCYGLDERTYFISIPPYHHSYHMPLDQTIVRSNMDIMEYPVHIRTRRIDFNWQRVQHTDGRGVEWDYDIESNTLFVRSR